MLGPFSHEIDPITLSIDGVHLWWYGLSFTQGFLNAHFFLRRNRERVGLSLAAVYDTTLFLAVGVMAGRSLAGRLLRDPFGHVRARPRAMFPRITARDVPV